MVTHDRTLAREADRVLFLKMEARGGIGNDNRAVKEHLFKFDVGADECRACKPRLIRECSSHMHDVRKSSPEALQQPLCHSLMTSREKSGRAYRARRRRNRADKATHHLHFQHTQIIIKIQKDWNGQPAYFHNISLQQAEVDVSLAS